MTWRSRSGVLGSGARGDTAVPRKLYYRIGEACRAVDIQPYVLRYWETEFEALAPGKSKSGQRVYTEQELGVIRRIKELLYEEGYTIAGAKKRLQSELAEGRLGPHESEGELFDGEAGAGDEPPVIEVGGGRGGEEEPSEPTLGAGVGAAGEDSDGEAATGARRPAPVIDVDALSTPPEPIHAAASDAPAGAEGAGSGATRAAAKGARGRATRGTQRRKGGAAPPVDTSPTAAASASAAPAGVRDAGAAEPVAAAVAPALATPGGAVDSALSQRVETLENGLRRVLDEVRKLRQSLADPGKDR